METFQHLLTRSQTDRGTGDIEFFRMLGRVAADHPEDLTKLQDLKGLEIPDAVAKSGLQSLAQQVQSLKSELHARTPITLRQVNPAEWTVGPMPGNYPYSVRRR